MNSKKWLKIWLFIIFICTSLIGSFNYYTDSLGIINKFSYLDSAAKDLADGNIIAGLRNFDERVFRKKTIEQINRNIEWIAVGSSRTMQLRKRMFLKENKEFQNYSVSGASLEDYLALIQIHYNHFGEFPKNIILGIDPWIFNKNSGQNRFTSIYNEYELMMQNLKIDVKNKKQNNISKIFSLEYTKQNILFVKNNLSTNLKGYYLVKDTNIDDYLREPDGSIQYPYIIRYPDFNKVKKVALQYAKGSVYSLERFSKISNRMIFNKFIKYLRDYGVNIYFYLPPYNPYTYDKLMERKYYIIKDVEKYVKSIAIKNDIKVIGSYNPHNIELSNKNFFDGMHPLDNAYYELFSEINEKN